RHDGQEGAHAEGGGYAAREEYLREDRQRLDDDLDIRKNLGAAARVGETFLDDTELLEINEGIRRRQEHHEGRDPPQERRPENDADSGEGIAAGSGVNPPFIARGSGRRGLAGRPDPDENALTDNGADETHSTDEQDPGVPHAVD